MIERFAFSFEKRNDQTGRLTKRGEIHVLRKPGTSGMIYLEIWGYKAGKGYAKYLDIYGDDYRKYFLSRLNSKGLTQIDGKNAHVMARFDQLEDDQVEQLIIRSTCETMAEEKDATSKLKILMGRFDTAPADSGGAMPFKTMYEKLNSYNSGGLDLDDGSNPVSLFTTATITAAPIEEQPKPITYENWGAY